MDWVGRPVVKVFSGILSLKKERKNVMFKSRI